MASAHPPLRERPGSPEGGWPAAQARPGKRQAGNLNAGLEILRKDPTLRGHSGRRSLTHVLSSLAAQQAHDIVLRQLGDEVIVDARPGAHVEKIQS